MPKTWRLPGLADTFVIARRAEVTPEQQQPTSLALLALQLDRWLADPFAQAILLDLYESLSGSAALARRTRGYDLQRYVKPQLFDAFRRGDLVLLRMPHMGVIPIAKEGAKEEPPAEDAPPAAKQKTWIEIEMVDEDGNPVAGVKYRLELPDGSLRGGNLDSNGRAHIAGIDPGTCKVSFPDLDANDWESA